MNNVQNFRNSLKSESATFMNSPRKMKNSFQEEDQEGQSKKDSNFSQFMQEFMLKAAPIKAIIELIKK